MFCSFYVYKFGLLNIGVYRVLLTFGVSLKATLGTAAFFPLCAYIPWPCCLAWVQIKKFQRYGVWEMKMSEMYIKRQDNLETRKRQISKQRTIGICTGEAEMS